MTASLQLLTRLTLVTTSSFSSARSFHFAFNDQVAKTRFASSFLRDMTLIRLALLVLTSVLSSSPALAANSSSPALAANSFPIILVNGFSGWGRDELKGFRYWGGIIGDFQNELTAKGYTVYTAAVGPFSSNWDRACELYTIIKGGQVDYGQKHSATHNHLRYGRNYTGLYPNWGTTNSDGSVNKVHLVGHSMGGQTIRMLAQLLEHGTTGAPIEEDPASHPLFKGGKSWVHSITTISTPNQGTTLADYFSPTGDSVKGLLVGVLSVVGILGDSAKMVYDAKLDQWGITPKQSGETVQKYIDRVFSSSIFSPEFKDVSLWSLSTVGAKEEATWVKTLNDVYYFSYATIDTHETTDWWWRKVSRPNLRTMLPLLDPLALILGGRYAPDTLKLSTDWQPNDGVVNTISMDSDGVGPTVTYAGAVCVRGPRRAAGRAADKLELASTGRLDHSSGEARHGHLGAHGGDHERRDKE
ncbi:hypothetical protein ON010_g17780 [Phytophthora cinnamomi]|nr:hypothetical protein ON010_g17780 [Phytophthora cinnamomi]